MDVLLFAGVFIIAERIGFWQNPLRALEGQINGRGRGPPTPYDIFLLTRQFMSII